MMQQPCHNPKTANPQEV